MASAVQQGEAVDGGARRRLNPAALLVLKPGIDLALHLRTQRLAL